jgi:tol-pal system protein YbgF
LTKILVYCRRRIKRAAQGVRAVLLTLPPRRRAGLGLALALSLAASGALAQGFRLPFDFGGQNRVEVAQSQEQAQLLFQIQQLQDSIRSLTGQVEQLQFQVRQMQQAQERQAQDIEHRFGQLEGGAPGKTEAATGNGGARPAALPPPATAPLPPAGTAPADRLGDSHDPLLGTGGGRSQLGTLSDAELATTGTGRPLNLSLDNGGPISNGDAQAQYAAGYEAIIRGDYAFAEDQFRQFVALYPDDPQAPDAANWLGESLLQLGAYDEAADALMSGFEKYRDAPRAPDLLLKLGVALAGAGEVETACRTFHEVGRRYPNVSPAFATRLSEERSRAQCPA